MKEKAKINCEVCNKSFKGDIQDYMCCNGYMCGCYGRPIEPVVCSLWCYCYAYHIREGMWSVIKNYIYALFINTKLGKYILKMRQDKSLKKFDIKQQP